jgi:hypothetical protein
VVAGLNPWRRRIDCCPSCTRRLGDRLSAFELPVAHTASEAVLAFAPETQDALALAHPWYVLAEIADSAREAGLWRLSGWEESRSGIANLIDAVIAQSVEQGARCGASARPCPKRSSPT